MNKPLPLSPLYTRAIAFLERHQGEYLAPDEHRLVTRCSYHLVDHGALSLIDAKAATLQALGELSARGCRRAYIDLDYTTGYALVVSGSNGGKTAYTLSQVLRALEQAEAAGTF